MASISLTQSGAGFYGYATGNTTYGYYNVTLEYSSVTRSGNTVTVNSAQIKMANPNYGYTTNIVYVDSVTIHGTDVGISGNAKGGTSYHTWSTTAKNVSFTVSDSTTSVSVTMYGHRQGQSASVQVLSGTLTVPTRTYSITYSANGGSGGTTKTLTRGSGILANAPAVSMTNYSLSGWYTAASGGSIVTSSTTATADTTYYAHWSANITACGTPSSISISRVAPNEICFSCITGNSGVSNTALGVEYFVTFDGTTPTTTNYHCLVSATGSSGGSADYTFFMTQYSQATWSEYFGVDCSGTVKIAARTYGSAGSGYYSGLSAVASESVWYCGAPAAPAVITNPKGKLIKGKNSSDSCYVSWNAATAGVNDTIGSYTLYVYNAATNALVTSYSTTSTTRYKYVPNSVFTAENTYYFKVRTHSADSGLTTDSLKSCLVEFKNITTLSTPVLTITNAGTVPSTNILGQETFLNIGTGDVLKFSWSSVSGTNNEVSNYGLWLYPADDDPYYTNGTDDYFDYSFSNLANECYVPASALNSGGRGWHKFTYEFYASSLYGSYYNSSIITGTGTFINDCSGVYIKLDSTNSNYPQPIMKRAVAFVKEPVSGEWKVCQGAFYKNQASSTWKASDISYEVLVDQNNEVITDTSNEPIYTL